MENALRGLLLKHGLGDSQITSLENVYDAPSSTADLASGADSEDDARTWARELGLQGRVVVGRFVRAWHEAKTGDGCGAPKVMGKAADSCEAATSNSKSFVVEERNEAAGCSAPVTSLGKTKMVTEECKEEDNTNKKPAAPIIATCAKAAASSSAGVVVGLEFAPPPRRTSIKEQHFIPPAAAERVGKFAQQSCPVLGRRLSQGSTRASNNSTSASSTDSAPNHEDLNEESEHEKLSSHGFEGAAAGTVVYHSISACPLFVGLQAQALSAIQAEVTLQERRAAGDLIFSAGQDAHEMYFVLSGSVSIVSADGSRLLDAEAGSFLGEIGALFAGTRSAGAIVSQGPCQLAVLERSGLERVTRKHGVRELVYKNGQALPHVRSWFASRLPLFAQCADEPGFLTEVAGELEVRTAAPGDVVLQEGADGDEMFFIFEGTVSITKRQQSRPVRITAPAYFGELALLFSEPRSATVRCENRCSFYVLSRVALHRIMQKFPRVITKVYTTAQEATNLKRHFIKKIPLFHTMCSNEEFLANMQLALESTSVAPGEFILRQGDVSDGRMFAIAHGHAEIRKVKQAGEPAQRVAALSTGAMFGEIALLLDTPRVASVLAVGHCHLYTLSRDAFETLAVVYPAWWRNLTSERGALLKQLQATGVEINSTATTRTHGLSLPQVAGKSVSSMLSAAEAPATVSTVPESKLCVVCRCNEKCVLSIPCGHVAACESCHASLKSCPMCRVSIERGVKAFF
jgi:CRP-like cAMP-binding protein